MKKKLNDNIHWVCYDCGTKYGNGRKPGVSTWHNDKCDICGKETPVTEIRDFGYLKGQPTHQTLGDYI